MPACGGLGPETQLDSENDALITGVVTEHFKCKNFSSPENFKIVSVRTQVVAGTNYFVKVAHNDEGVYHFRIYHPLPHTGRPMEISKVLEKKRDEDLLEYF